MSCCIPTKSTTERNLSPQNSSSINVRRDILVRIPECKVILMNEGEAGEVAAGDFELQWISDGDVALAAAAKVGEELQWPLTKDEPVVKLDALNYLFSLQMNDGQPLSYGVAFAESSGGHLGQLDALLAKHCLFTAAQKKRNVGIDWKKFAPAVDQYNTQLGQAIARGTGHVIRGIFRCTEAYTNKVQEIGETILIPAVGEDNTGQPEKISDSGAKKNKASSLNKALIHAKKLTKMTYEITKTMVDVIDEASESVREARVASIDAVKMLLEATEDARNEAIKASAGAVQDAVTRRCGERAGERTGHVFEIVGNCASTLCNIFKIRKAIVSCWTTICCCSKSKKKNMD